MGEIAPNASYHYWGFGIKGASLTKDKYAQCKVLPRGLDFESGNEIGSETDEGHTGGANLDMGSYRSTAESQPEWNDAIRYGEGIEDIWYMLLGSVNRRADTGTDLINHIQGDTYTDTKTGNDNVYKYHYEFPPSYAPELPYSTVYNGFAKTHGDARVFNDCILNELKFTVKNDTLPRYDAKFISDYNNFNMENPTRVFPARSIFAKPKHVNVYYADTTATESDMLNHKLGCFIESEFTVNNNYETKMCQDDEFGKNNKYMGTRETEGSINLPWNDLTKKFQTEYEGGTKDSHIVTHGTIYKQIWYELKGSMIGDTNIPYTTLIKFPVCEITNVDSPLSGDDAKDLTIEYKIKEEPTQSFMTVDVITHLEELHVDNVGVDIDDLYLTPAPTT